jgi:hypothetical protein
MGTPHMLESISPWCAFTQHYYEALGHLDPIVSLKLFAPHHGVLFHN